MLQTTIAFHLNGKPVSVTVDPDRMLLWILRSDLTLTGTKFGCGEGLCGACTVVVGSEAVRACVTPLRDVAGKRVLTIEGLGAERLHAVQQAFLDTHAFQCGYCTPGMIMNAYALLQKTARPTREQIVSAMDGNLCRCGSQPRIVAAVQMAAKAGKAGA